MCLNQQLITPHQLRKVFLLATVFWLIGSSTGYSFSLWEVDRLDMEFVKYRPGYRNSYLMEDGRDDPDTQDGLRPMKLQDGAALNLDLGMLEYLYWRNRFHMASDMDKHVRHVGWEWEAGISLESVTRGFLPLEVFEHHHSQHGLEYVNPRGDKFEVEDTYGIRFILIERKGNKQWK